MRNDIIEDDDEVRGEVMEGEVITPRYTFLALLNEKNQPNSKLTLEVIEEVCEGIASGATLHECCRRVKIVPDTMQRWRRKGELNLADKKAEINKYGLLVEAMKMAAGEWATNEIKKMQEHGETDWRASAWLLERMLPEQFGPNRESSGLTTGGGSSDVSRVDQNLLDVL